MLFEHGYLYIFLTKLIVNDNHLGKNNLLLRYTNPLSWLLRFSFSISANF